ncbi:MAG: bifunctional phosphopantothenoylcysteine decarboxylase/phosphopantothenate--cysteine ligase CoaBC [Bacteroidetes bacterium]|nr:bifunctional phosphopantothenoylcysteine decarboxylase/phosphopantothenate--cysteine ligase CoaBC [Bacteroidota bacterium]MDA1175917.1 bifunctional phosphopantothenoylcysteine decarboxylase/phosphopantothenate--cysteine ligase CoaBC [Bacteroidota bacterium]
MSILRGKNILLGISAGIAAYKTAFLVRLFVKAGAHVRVIMTPSAKEFVTPLTLSTLSDHPVLSDFTDENDDNAVWNNHVELGLWADLFVVAPATANTLSKMASGNSDNFLIATYLSAKCPVYFAPAMDLDMYKHPTTKNALDKLQSFGNILIPSAFGELASGLVGMGRMAEPGTIVETIEQHLLEGLPLYGKKILVTAGPTHEAIDPVRYIGNHSSGRMGFEIANTAAQLGAEVILISGPTHYKALYDSIQTIPITTARDMYDAAHQYFKDVDAAILSAAVADYRPKFPAASKLKKKSSSLVLELEKTEDVLASLGEIKEKQLLIGFALETENEVANAIKKLKAKNLDLIILNSLNDDGAGFGGSTNKISIIDKDLNQTNYPLKSKSEVADDIINELIKRVHA